MLAGGLKSVVQNVASGKIAKNETPVPSNVSQILVLSDAWIDTHTTALARAEMNLDKVLRSSDDFLKSLQSLAKCVYAMPSGSERYQYPFALGIHFELKRLLQEAASKRERVEQHLSQIRQERSRFADLMSLLNKRSELKALIQSSFKHVYNPQSKTLDVFISVSAHMKDQWEVTQVVDSLQKLEVFKSRFLSDQFADTKDFVWDWCDRLAYAIDLADQVTSQRMIEIESEMEAEYVRRHLRTPGDEIWLPESLHQQLEAQKGERMTACRTALHDHLLKAHGGKSLKDVDLDAVVQDEPGFRAATDSFFRRLALLNGACSHLREALDHLYAVLFQYKQLLDVQMLFYRLPRAASAPSVALEGAITAAINQVMDTSAAITRDVEKLVQQRSEELWAPFIRADAASSALEKVVEQVNARGDIAYYRAKIAELEQGVETKFGSTREKIARNRLKLSEIQREYNHDSDDLRADFAHIEVVCKDYYRAFELNFFDALDRALAPLSKELKVLAVPGQSEASRQIRSANNSRIIARSAGDRPGSTHSDALNAPRRGDVQRDNHLSRVSTSIRNMRARDVQLANARASRRPPPLQPPEQLLHDCLEACDMFAEVHSKITPSDFPHIQFSKLVEGSNVTGRMVEWLCVRRVGRDASQSAQALQGGVVIAINGQSIVGVPVQSAQKMLDDLSNASANARLVVRHRRTADAAFSHYLERTLNGSEDSLTASNDLKFDFRMRCYKERVWTAIPTPVSRQLILATVAVKTNATNSRLSTNFRNTMKAQPGGPPSAATAAATNKAHTMKPNPVFDAQSKAPGSPGQQHHRPSKPRAVPAEEQPPSSPSGRRQQQQQPLSSPSGRRQQQQQPLSSPSGRRQQQQQPLSSPSGRRQQQQQALSSPSGQRQQQQQQHRPYQTPAAKAAAVGLVKGPKPPPMKRPSATRPAPEQAQAVAPAIPAIDLLSPSATTPSKQSAGSLSAMGSRKGSMHNSSQKEMVRHGSTTTPAKGGKRNFLEPAVEAPLFENADLHKPPTGSPQVRKKSFVRPVVAAPLPPELSTSLPPAPPPPPAGTPPAQRPDSKRSSQGHPSKRPPSLRPESNRVSSIRSSGREPSSPSSLDSPRAGSRASSKIGALFGRDFSTRSVDSNSSAPNAPVTGSPSSRSRTGSKRISKRESQRESSRMARATVVLAPPPITSKPAVILSENATGAAAGAPGHHRRNSSLAVIREILVGPQDLLSAPETQTRKPSIPGASQPNSRKNSLNGAGSQPNSRKNSISSPPSSPPGSKPASRKNSLVRETETGTFVFGAAGPIDMVVAAQSIDSVLRARATKRRTTLTPPVPQKDEEPIPISVDIVSTPIWQRRRRSSLAEVEIKDALSKPV